MTVAYKGIGTGANGSTTVGPTCPATVDAGDLLVAIITSGATNNETPTPPAGQGWNSLGSYTATDGQAFGVDTGARRVTAFYKEAAGTEDGATVTFSITNGNTCRGTILSFSKTDATWEISSTGGNDDTAGTSVSIAGSAVQWKVGQCVVVGAAQLVDNSTQSSQSLTATGVTFGTRTNRSATAVTTGNDHRHSIDTFAATTAGNTSTAPTWAYTASSSATVAAAVIILIGELKNITTGVGGLTLDSVAPTASIPIGIGAGVGALTIAGQVPTIDVTSTRLKVSWAAFEIPLQDPVAITSGVGGLTLTGYSPGVKRDWTVAAGVGGLTLTGYVPTAQVGGGISPNITTDVGELALAGYIPTAGVTGTERLRVSWVDFEIPLQDPVAITAGVGALAMDSVAPTVSGGTVGGNLGATPGVGTLTVAGYVPGVANSEAPDRLRISWVQFQTPEAPSLTRFPDFGALTFSGYAPSIDGAGAAANIPTGLGALTLTGYLPEQTLQLPSPVNATLTLAGFAPTVQALQVITAGAGGLTFTGYVPVPLISLPPNVNVSPRVGDLSLAGLEPSVAVTENFWATSGLGALSIAGYAPTAKMDTAAAPGYADLSLAGYAPTTMQGGSWTIYSETGQLRLTGYDPARKNSGDRDEETTGGGWSHWNPPERTRKQIEEERQKFGVLPKPVQRALKRAVKKVIERADEGELVESILAGEPIDLIAQFTRTEIALSERQWRAAYDLTVQALILQALRERAQIEAARKAEVDAFIARQLQDQQDQAEVAELWGLWTRM